MNCTITGMKRLALAAGLLALSPLAFADISTSECSSATSCTFNDFANGGSLTVNGITLEGAAIVDSMGEYTGLDLDALSIVGDDSNGAGFSFTAADGIMDLSGDAFGILNLVFDVVVTSGDLITSIELVNNVNGTGLWSAGTSFGDGESIFVEEIDGTLDDGGIILFGATDPNAIIIIDPREALTLFGTVDNRTEEEDVGPLSAALLSMLLYDGFTLRFNAIPEPTALMLMLFGLAAIGLRRRH